MTVVAIITARKNSKSLPGKNMKLLGGKPLIQYTLEIASKISSFDKVVLSTDIDEAIALASHYPSIEVPFKRPAYLCEDNASQVDVAEHALRTLREQGNNVEAFVLLQPTSPFRYVHEMEEGVRLLKSGCRTVLGVAPVMHHPADYLRIDESGKISFLFPEFRAKRRQDFPPVYFNNGAFYGCETEYFLKKRAFYDEESALLQMSDYSLIDVDTRFDFELAELLTTRYDNGKHT